MVLASGLLRIFWPSDLPRNKSQGTLVGWRNASWDVFVVAVLQDVEVRSLQASILSPVNGPQAPKVESALRVGTLLRSSPHPMQQIYDMCGNSSLHVLGSVNPKLPPNGSFDLGRLTAYTEASSPFPDIYCPKTCNVSVQIIIFDRPSPRKMQYMSLNPISLALGDKDLRDDGAPHSLGNNDADDEVESVNRARLVKKLQLHTVIRHSPSQKEVMLPTILAQINCSSELATLLAKNTYLLRTRPKRSLSVSEKVVESATTIRNYIIDLAWHVLTVWVWPLLTRCFVMALIFHRTIAEVILRVLEWRPRPDSAALKDISATAQQIDIRLQQFCYWPMQYLTLRKRKDDWESVTDRHPDYIRFFNSLWLVANDVIIGIALGSYIIDNAPWVAWQINTVLMGWTVEGLRDIIAWLMDWPAGLKLNTELAVFLGDLFLWVIDVWKGESSPNSCSSRMLIHEECVIGLQPLLPHVIYFIGFSSFAGATMPISMFSDLLSLLTVHIYCFYTASARIFHWQLTIIMSLFHLFRGKKHNVLRNRIDSCDYDLDQLLLGTILFTLLFFLLPTVAVFYITFTSARMAIIFLKAALDTSLACLNHFPLFALMLRVKDSRRLPGQYFELGVLEFQLTCPRRHFFRPSRHFIRFVFSFYRPQ